MGKRIRPGQRVKDWRTSQKPRMTQAALGGRAGLSGDAIRHFENSDKTIALDAKVGLCHVMGCPLAWLLSPSEMEMAHRIRDLIEEQVA